jgi:hypothetical protein
MDDLVRVDAGTLSPEVFSGRSRIESLLTSV